MMQGFDEQPDRDERKAKRFFDYARVVSDARNYDYAIVCWINGLKHAPSDLRAHMELLEVARQREKAGGKPLDYHQLKNAPNGRTPVDDMLLAEYYWAHDSQNTVLAGSVIEYARIAEMYEVADWVARVIRSNSKGE